ALAGVWSGRVRRVALADEQPAHPSGLPPADLVGRLEPDRDDGPGRDVAAGTEGEAMRAAAAGLARLARVDQPEQAMEPLNAWLRPGDVVLLKASRGVALERLIPLLPSL
ncbi:MAG: hypothetical protein ACK550_00345, partial [Synechococcaceae cyanobacterium]